MKRAIFLAVMLMAGVACAEPFLVCDPQEGVEKYRLRFEALDLTIELPAEAAGELMYDVGTWAGPGGWHNGSAVACDSYQLEDSLTGAVTTIERCTEPAFFRLKIPKMGPPTGYRLQ